MTLCAELFKLSRMYTGRGKLACKFFRLSRGTPVWGECKQRKFVFDLGEVEGHRRAYLQESVSIWS